MTSQGVTKAAAEAVHAMSEARSGRGFAKGVRQFLDALGAVPDFPSDQLTNAEVEELRTSAERVIGAIELRLEDGHDKTALQQELTEAIYDIRRELEEIDRWRRHFLGT